MHCTASTKVVEFTGRLALRGDGSSELTCYTSNAISRLKSLQTMDYMDVIIALHICTRCAQTLDTLRHLGKTNFSLFQEVPSAHNESLSLHHDIPAYLVGFEIAIPTRSVLNDAQTQMKARHAGRRSHNAVQFHSSDF
eukprot:2206580-Amphidinium_carterae.2